MTPNQTVTAASESDLQQQEFRPEEKGKEGYIYLTNNQVAKTQKGWKIDLRDGERVNVKTDYDLAYCCCDCASL